MCERSDLEEYNPSSWIWVFTDLGWIRTLRRSGMKLFRPSYTFSSLGKFKEHSFIPPCSSTVNMTSDKLILTKSPTIPSSFSCSNASTLSSQESYNVSRVREATPDHFSCFFIKLRCEFFENFFTTFSPLNMIPWYPKQILLHCEEAEKFIFDMPQKTFSMPISCCQSPPEYTKFTT